MIPPDRLNAILELAKRDEVGFCLRMAADLTVRVRGLYDLGNDEAVGLYRAFNELLHLIVNQALNAARTRNRYKLEEFFDILINTADQRGVGRAIHGTLEFLLTRNTLS